MGEIFIKLVNMSITASWLILVVLGVRFLFRKMPKWINCLLWGVVAFRLIFPFSIESEFSLQPSAEPIQATAMVEGEVMAYVPSLDSNVSFVENTVNPLLAETFAYQKTESVAPLQVFVGIAGNLWLGGMMILLVFALGSIVRLHLFTRESVHYSKNVYLCDRVKSPFILGIIHPKIYLSSALKEEEIDYIIAHEKAHLQRKDHLWKPCGYLLLCIYWFNPLCWIAYLMLCKDIELACDEKVIKKMSFSDKKEYAKVLLSCAAQRRLVFVCPLAFGEVGVKERVQTILKYKNPAFWITMAAMALCVILALCFLTNPSRQYQIRITIPAGSTEAFCYSDEEISPKGNTLMIANGEGLGDTSVVLLPVEYREENTYEPSYITPGMPVKMDVEKGAWFKIGVNMQNPTTEDIHAYVSVRHVEVRIASPEGENLSQVDKTESNQGTVEKNTALQDLAYYLELSALGMEFQPMSEGKKTEIMAEYGKLLDEYTLMARESIDRRTEYIVGYYSGEVMDSPLYLMKDKSYFSDKKYQILYLEENEEAMDKIIDEQGIKAITEEGYVIENSHLFWSLGAEYIFIQPIEAEQELYSAFVQYFNPTRGRQYIEDALARGIAINELEEPYLSIFMLSEKYGEITEKIPLTEEEAIHILTEDTKKLADGYGFGATLRIDGEAHYYSGNKVPQTVLDLAEKKCGYEFVSPESIAAPIIEARLDCNWLEASLYLDTAYLSQLEKILKGAKYTGVGDCGYGAKLILTLENGETLTIFKGTDDCGSLVFGSWGGYSISDKADDEFWQIFGLCWDEKQMKRVLQEESTQKTEEDRKNIVKKF